jgi:YHS domain-containing protein
MTSVSLKNSSVIINPFQTVLSKAISSNTRTLPEMQVAIKAIQNLGFQIEICGSWIWVFGADRSDVSQLTEANFKWSYRRGCWYFCSTESKSKSQKNSHFMGYGNDT